MHRLRIKKSDALKLGTLTEAVFDARRKEADAKHEAILAATNGVELHYMPLGNAGYYELRTEDLTAVQRLVEIHGITVYDRAGKPIELAPAPA